MCIINCITNGWLIGIIIIKGRNSEHNKITHNKDNFRDGVCLKSLCVIIWTYRKLIKAKLSDILQCEPFRPSYIIGQLTGSVLNTGKKGSKQLF